MSMSALAGTDPLESVGPDLDIVEQNRHSEILAVTDVDWTIYSKIQLEKATVEFRDRWVHDQWVRNRNTIREKDIKRIKSDMADLLDEVLTRELSTKGGYVFTDQSGLDVMRVTPSITDLDIVAPDRVRDHIGYALTDSQLSMTMGLEIFDSVNGELLATAGKYDVDPLKGYMEWTTSPTNKRAARFMLQRWSTWLRKWLDDARGGASD
jgi:hypothetical protein